MADLFNAFDDLCVLDNIIFNRKDLSAFGCYRNGVETLKKDMNEEELTRAEIAHAKLRQRTFKHDIGG